MIKYRIPLKGLKVSTNKIYEGIHWTKRREHKDSISGYARAFCRPIQVPESYPVEIRYRFLFRTRALDTLNCAYMAKMFEDSLRTLEVLEDDSPKFVARSIIESIVVPARKGKATRNAPGKKVDEEDEDWLEIIINSFKEND